MKYISELANLTLVVVAKQRKIIQLKKFKTNLKKKNDSSGTR